ncbi:MAG: PQQ-dependent sugar dehydrogenase [Actinomycetota bacterium]
MTRAELRHPARAVLAIAGLALAASLLAIVPAAAQDESTSRGDSTLGLVVEALVPSPSGQGYRIVGTDGRVVAYGDASFEGSAGDLALNQPIVDAFPDADDDGYVLVAADGGIFNFAASFHGSTGSLQLNAPIVGAAGTPTGEGYWLFAADGGVFAFGDARFFGSMGGQPLNQPIVDGVGAPDGEGYWLVASDGGIFAFGSARFFGSMGGQPLNRPVVDMSPAPDGEGYWLFAADGGVFAFGSAGFLGSGAEIQTTFQGFAITPAGDGYWAVTPEGALQNFGNAGRFGAPIAGPPGRDVTPSLERIGTFTQPVALRPNRLDPDGGGLLVAERTGRIRAWWPATDRRELVVDLSNLTSASGERGLLSFDLDEGASRLWVSYTDGGGDLVIAEYPLTSSGGDEPHPIAGARRQLLEIDQPFGNHNGGDLHVGPDGNLWISSGDGGSSGDPQNNAQNRRNLLGGILRIDPTPTPGGAAYTVPDDNPFVGDSAGLDELWAYGLRNPWRISFDRSTDDLWIGDVGQGRREEINVEPAGDAGGRNYGWRILEGTLPFGGSPQAGLTGPIHEYGHTGGRCSVTGGVVYRGAELAGLEGRYLFGDFCSGEVWTLRPVGDGAEVERLSGVTVPQLVAFGEDVDGEVWLLSLGGGVFRLDPTA